MSDINNNNNQIINDLDDSECSDKSLEIWDSISNHSGWEELMEYKHKREDELEHLEYIRSLQENSNKFSQNDSQDSHPNDVAQEYMFSQENSIEKEDETDSDTSRFTIDSNDQFYIEIYNEAEKLRDLKMKETTAENDV